MQNNSLSGRVTYFAWVISFNIQLYLIHLILPLNEGLTLQTKITKK